MEYFGNEYDFPILPETKTEVFKAIMPENLFTEVSDLFWTIYADETKKNPEVRAASYDVLKALHKYKKSLNGGWI